MQLCNYQLCIESSRQSVYQRVESIMAYMLVDQYYSDVLSLSELIECLLNSGGLGFSD